MTSSSTSNAEFNLRKGEGKTLTARRPEEAQVFCSPPLWFRWVGRVVLNAPYPLGNVDNGTIKMRSTRGCAFFYWLFALDER